MLALLASPLGRWCGIALVIGALGLWGYAERTGRQWANERARAAELEVRSRDAAIEALERQAAETAALTARTAAIRNRIRGVPNGTACAGSPPVRAALAGLRVTSPDGARQPAVVPAAASNPRRQR